MNVAPSTTLRIEAAVAGLGSGALTESALARHVAPLFARVLAAGSQRVYLANHSLGRPLDATADDVQEALAAWYSAMGGAWDAWAAEMHDYRQRLAALTGAPRADCIVPKASAGQGLRAVLNSYDGVPRVVATRGEFDSLDVILREYARRGRIALTLVEPEADGHFATPTLIRAIQAGAELVIVSQVMFSTGQRLADLAGIVAATHAAGARILVDTYHALAVFPVDLAALDVDFAVGGSYKYLRGGTGACFLYLHPRHLDGSLRTLDTGWFAKREPFAYRRPDPPEYGDGGDAFLESTPAVLPFYQARAGQVFTRALGVDRIRAYSLQQQQQLVALLAERNVPASGGTSERGAFVTIVDSRAEDWSAALRTRDVVTDARGRYLRLCPDVLTREAELVRAADAVAAVAAG
jgi:kynureninase